MAAGLISAPQAEYALRTSSNGTPGRPHHAVDEQELLGLASDTGSPVRIVLARVAAVMPTQRWVLLLPRPGRLRGLRGPVPTNRLALECGAIVVARDGGLAWLPRPVGPAMQWQLVAAQRPIPPSTPGEAARALNEQVLDAARELGRLDAPAGRRPEGATSITLGPAYPAANQELLDRALLWREACRAGLDASPASLHSHAVLARETQLRTLEGLCEDAVSAAASWPHHH
ncbi:hypothetical protein SAMN05443377_101143 [Propionibacterium cyclohexanicum]|uniref:Uncharacterized protein n=2 Tax=Propionibacterium cyclohexanicum TaxID=64702 RepID=A0A1H9PNB4_9ACTN|nr:hypothetical protein SAMN05443377_101143 [Propionibacterium cyclohexanicum]